MTSYEHTHPYWAARLSTAIAVTVSQIKPPEARRHLRDVLDDYLRSQVPSEETRLRLREEMRK